MQQIRIESFWTTTSINIIEQEAKLSLE